MEFMMVVGNFYLTFVHRNQANSIVSLINYYTMKRIVVLFALIIIGTPLCSAAMSRSRVRKEALYLTDKMGYELRLSGRQMDDVYEINYDFIYAIRSIMDEVLDGYEWAIDDYYDYLDIRNDDLRYVLTASQYRQFLRTEDFYRPIYQTSSGWAFRIHLRYVHGNLFFMARPSVYHSYAGHHYRTYHNNVSFYMNLYHHHCYGGSFLLRPAHHTIVVNHVHVNDFGHVNVIHNSHSRPANAKTVRSSMGQRMANGDVPRVGSTAGSGRKPESTQVNHAGGTDNRGGATRGSNATSGRRKVSGVTSRSSETRSGNSRSTTTTSSSRSATTSGSRSTTRSGSSRSTTTTNSNRSNARSSATSRQSGVSASGSGNQRSSSSRSATSNGSTSRSSHQRSSNR